MNKEIMSYWLTLYDERNNISWEGIVNGKAGPNGEFMISAQETDPYLLHNLRSSPYIRTEFVPAWEVVYLLKEKH